MALFPKKKNILFPVLVVQALAVAGTFTLSEYREAPFANVQLPEEVHSRIVAELEKPVASNVFRGGRAESSIPELSRISGIEKRSHKVARGETLAKILLDNEISSSDIPKLSEVVFGEDEGPHSLRPGHRLEFIRSSLTGELLELRRPRSTGGYRLILREDEGRFSASEIRGLTFSEERKVAGTIFRSMAATAQQLDIPYDIVDEFVDLFSDRIEFRRDVRRGDTFSIIFEETRDERGRPVKSGPIRGASLKRGSKTLVAVRYVGKDGKARYFDEEGRPQGNQFLRYPVRFTRISSVFSKARFHPVLQRWKPHNGVDFAAPIGTPVRSVGDGVVTYAGWKGANGLLVKIKHNNRYDTAYVHLSKIDKGIRKGTRVSRGQRIGRVGKTGRATGPHLHFSLYDRGKYVDPLKAKLPLIVEKENRIPKSVLYAQLRELEEQYTMLALNTIDDEARS